MDAAQMLAMLAPTATIRELAAGSSRVFRIIEESGRSSIVKVYSSAPRERRERHALDALAGIPGVPKVYERGTTENLPWLRMKDAGSWNLANLPVNQDIINKAGAVLRGIHDSEASITNLEGGLDEEYVQSHYLATLDRLERFRRRLNLPAEVLAAAKKSENLPQGSFPVPSHTRAYPSSFIVDDYGNVTLVGWAHATLAPPEWDLSMATWKFTRDIGPETARALWEGYGASFPQHRLKPWIAYHAANLMMEAAESRDGRLGDLSSLIADFQAAIR